MDYQELIERMRAFNDWRRGGDFEMPRPRQIGMDIDAMCDAIESLLNALDIAEGEVKRTAAERDAALAELAKYRDAPVVAYLYLDTNGEECFGHPDGYWPEKYSNPLIVKPGENK